MQEFYTDDPKTFEDYGRIINKRHFKRIMALMEGSTVVVGGDSDESQCYIGMYVSGMMEPVGIPQNVRSCFKPTGCKVEPSLYFVYL